MHTLRREMSSALERKSIRASFANPSTGGAVTRTLSDTPCNPAISLFDAEAERELRSAPRHLADARQNHSHQAEQERLDDVEQYVREDRSYVEAT